MQLGKNYYAGMGFLQRSENYDALRDTAIRTGFGSLYGKVGYFFRKIKRQYQNPNDFTDSPFIPTLAFGIPDGFDVVSYCDEVLERGVNVNDFFQPRVKVNYKVRGEGENLAKLDKLLEHYAKSEWMEIALFDNLPVIEKVDLTSYLNKYRLEFDTGLRRLLYLKCPNLKEMSYQK